MSKRRPNMKTLNEPKENNKTGKEFELRFLHELY